MPKRKLEEEDSGVKKRRKIVRRQTPLGKFRQQTINRRKELLKIIRESNIELRAILRDLGRLKRTKNA